MRSVVRSEIGVSTREELIASCLPLSRHLAKRAWVSEEFLPLADLRQEALVGLVLAANTFDRNRGTEFSTHATWKIREAIQDAIRQRHKELPRAGSNAFVQPVRDVFLSDRYITDAGRRHGAGKADDVVERDDLWRHLTLGLSLRECDVLRMVFHEGCNFEEVGKLISLSREWVRRIHHKAVAKIRQRVARQERELCA